MRRIGMVLLGTTAAALAAGLVGVLLGHVVVWLV
jgi:hypothetical protein